MNRSFKRGRKIDEKYLIVSLLGGGGGGLVYEVESIKDKKRFAMKIFSNKYPRAKKKQRFKRFKNEVEILKTINKLSIPSTLLIDYNLSGGIKYFVMEKGITCEKYCYDSNFSYINRMKIILDVAKNLKLMHDNGIYHRDIKPSNIVNINSKHILIDFGTAKCEKLSNITQGFEKIGSLCTIPKELLQKYDEDLNGKIDFQFSDVFSLAKTLWIILTNQKDGFPGQYFSETSNSLKKRKIGFKTYLLIDELLYKSTEDFWHNRINLSDFITKLERIISIEEFPEKNNLLINTYSIRESIKEAVIDNDFSIYTIEDIGVMIKFVNNSNLDGINIECNGTTIKNIDLKYVVAENNFLVIKHNKLKLYICPSMLQIKNSKDDETNIEIIFIYDSELNYENLTKISKLNPNDLNIILQSSMSVEESILFDSDVKIVWK